MPAFVVAGAVTLGGIALYQATRSSGAAVGAVGPGGSRITIEHAQGTRDNNDLAVVTIEVLVEFGDQDAASAAQFKPTVRCIRALAFYTEALGLEKRAYNPTPWGRFLTVAPADDSVQVLLWPGRPGKGIGSRDEPGTVPGPI